MPVHELFLNPFQEFAKNILTDLERSSYGSIQAFGQVLSTWRMLYGVLDSKSVATTLAEVTPWFPCCQTPHMNGWALWRDLLDILSHNWHFQ